MVNIGNIDIGEVQYFEDNARYADLLNAYVFQGKQIVKEDDIIEMDSRVTSVEMETEKEKIRFTQRFRDVVRKTVFGVNYAVIVVENQENIHYAMPVRVMGTELRQYEKQLREIKRKHECFKDWKSDVEFLSEFAKEDILQSVVTLVVYYGKKPWDGPRDLYEMLDLSDIPEEMRKMINHYPIHVLEVRRFEHTEWFETDLKEVFEVIQHAENKSSLKKYLKTCGDRLMNMAVDACQLLAVATDTPGFVFRDKKYRTQQGGVNMCQGMKEWLEEERAEGRLETQRECTIKLFNKGKSLENVIEWLELDYDLVKQWHNEWCATRG